MAKRYPRENKEEVLKKIREGQRVSEVTKAHGIKVHWSRPDLTTSAPTELFF
jgi:transposase-like protein